MARKPKEPKQVEALTHDTASRKNIPTAEHQAVMAEDDRHPIEVAYRRRNPDLDPQLVWRGKDVVDWSDLVVPAPPVFIQEKVHPKALIDDLLRQSKENEGQDDGTPDLFADFNGLPDDPARTEFYQHDANWANRMILGDSLQVMASLAEREGLRGKVQCIYIDPPYGIKFNSNFQWSTRNRDVRDGKAEHITREPEQVKAFRDTWLDGIHSYLTYLRDRLTVARDLLTESGSVFVQIGDENVHRVRSVMDEVLGEDNFVALIVVKKTSAPTDKFIPTVSDFLVWYAKSRSSCKYRQLNVPKGVGEDGGSQYVWYEDEFGIERKLTKEERSRPAEVPSVGRIFAASDASSSHEYSLGRVPVDFKGYGYTPRNRFWSTSPEGMTRAKRSGRLTVSGKTLFYKRYLDDFPVMALTNTWVDTSSSFGERIYVVQTNSRVAQRCVLMTTDPGDLVLDPTCGSGTTAYVAEQWGRRWITIDTSRVALALARARVMGARYPYYLLSDSPEGQRKEAELSRKALSESPTQGAVRQGFVYERVPHITLKAIANNAEIDVIHEQHQAELDQLRDALNKSRGQAWEEWEVPRDAEDPWASDAQQTFFKLQAAREQGQERDVVRRLLAELNAALSASYTLDTLPPRPVEPWPKAAADFHAAWWRLRIERQKEIDASIAAKADYEYLYDKPYEDKKRVRVAGPFTVESLSPHRLLAIDEDDEPAGEVREARAQYHVAPTQDFASVILENLRTAGVHQAHKADRIEFSALTPWPGEFVCAEGRYAANNGKGKEMRAGIFIGPEFGTVSRPDLVDAAREAADAGFDVLIGCAFNYDAHAAEFAKHGRVPILKARMNADLHMADDLKNTGKGNLFVVFGEPDIDILPADGNGGDALIVKLNGVDVYEPSSGDVRSDETDAIACWFIDTDYDGESFFVRHAYFLNGQTSDPYKSLKTTLRAEIDADAWASLYSDTSRPFERPKSGRIAVKVINHLGDEVMKVFRL